MARHRQVSQLIASLNVLPTAVNVPMQILRMYRSAQAPPLDAFAQVLVADASLSAKVLELANSAWFSRSRQIKRISDALRMIGLDSLMPLLFGVSLAAIFNRAALPASERAALWQTSMLKGTIACEWARWRGIELAEEAFFCGVLQDVALPAMYASDPSVGMELAAVIALEDDRARVRREQSMFGADHAQFGKQICAALNLPAFFCHATEVHHLPDEATLDAGADVQLDAQSRDELKTILPGLRLAAAFPHRAQRLDDGAARRLAHCFAVAMPQVSGAEAADFISRAGAAIRGQIAAFNIGGEASTRMKEFLQDIADQIARTMTAAIGSTHRTIEQLRQAQAELEKRLGQLDAQVARAEHDSLTEVLNRRGFFERAEKLIVMARDLQMACVIGFVDMDELKLINDTHSHQTGDRALNAVAKALSAMVQSHGIIGRCGGDEFAFALAVPPSVRIETIAADLEQALSQILIEIPGGQIPVTASAGVVWLGVPAASCNLDNALRAADTQMYQAKHKRKSARGLAQAPQPNSSAA